jgi:hypothetical protein
VVSLVVARSFAAESLSLSVPHRLSMATRRRTLAAMASLATSLSGCLFFGFGGGGRGFDLTLAEREGDSFAAAAAVSATEFTDPQQRLFDDLSGSDTAVRLGRTRPFDDESLVVADGTYYLVTHDPVTAEPAPRPVVYAERTSAAKAKDEAVDPFRAYPDRDTRALKFVIATVDEREDYLNRTDATEIPPKFLYAFAPSEANRSALLPEPEHEYVVHGDEYYRLVVDEWTVPLEGREYTVTEVGDATAADAWLRENRSIYAVAPGDFSDREREILRSAMDEDGYAASEPYSDAETSLLRRFGVDPEAYNLSKQFYLRYDGTFFDGRLVIWHGD